MPPAVLFSIAKGVDPVTLGSLMAKSPALAGFLINTESSEEWKTPLVSGQAAPVRAATQTRDGDGDGDGQDLLTGMSVEFLDNVCSKLDPHSVSETARIFSTLFAGPEGVQLWKNFRSLELAKPVSAVDCQSNLRHLLQFRLPVHMCVPHVTLDHCGGGNKMYWRPTVEDVSTKMYQLELQQTLGSARIFDEYLDKGKEWVASAVYDLYTATERRELGTAPAPPVVNAKLDDSVTSKKSHDVLPKDMMMIRSEAIQQKMMHETDCTRNELLGLGVAWTQDADIWQGVFLTDQHWAGIKPRCVAILTEHRGREAAERARADS
ncbi:hypothetical protein RQP46_007758 [Phenoliferia psychrophenolica]